MKQKLKRPIALLLTAVMLLGLLPTAVFAAEPGGGPETSGKAGGGEITDLYLSNFMEFGGTEADDLNLLTQKDTIQWDVSKPYTLSVSVTLPAGAEDNHLTITLPEGMKFVSNPESLQNPAIEDVVWAKPDPIYGYQPSHGTVDLIFNSGTTGTSFELSIQPDLAFFPIEEKESGHLISDAIKVQLNGNEAVAVDVNVQTSMDVRTPYIGDTAQSDHNVAAGDTASLVTGVYWGWLGQSQEGKRLVTEEILTLSAPSELTFTSANWTVKNSGPDPDKKGNNLWTFTTKSGRYGLVFQSDFMANVSEDAALGSYEILQKELSVKAYGRVNYYEKELTGLPVWTITVRDPDEVDISISALPANNVYNATKLLNEAGDFDDYNTVLGSAKVVNNSIRNIEEALVYTASFDQTAQFITAVGIPCWWNDDTDYMPTKIVVTDETGKSYELTDLEEIRAAAFQPVASFGFILRAQDIPGYDVTKSIQEVAVELPGLPKGYQSTGGSPVMETASSNNAFAGVWGRIREDVDVNTKVTNQFSISLKDGGTPLAEQTSSTIVKENGGINGADSYDQTTAITVNGETPKVISGGDVVHIQQSIKTHSYHDGNRMMETMLYDPMIYLLEPEDLSIENVRFHTNDGTAVTGRKRDITKETAGLPAGYRLYEYKMADELMLGWWDGSWNSRTLYVEFDYRVDTAARTEAYNLSELIFYKSSKNLYIGRNGVEDQYHLNDGEQIGSVQSKTFTVQASSEFTVNSAIQIEGEDKWYSYNPEDAANTTAVFTEGAIANVRITVTNNTTSSASATEVYIPVPKTEGPDLGAAFIGQAEFDMSVAGEANLANAPGWSVQYGQVEEVTYNTNGIPEGFTLAADGGWSEMYSDNTNMVKLSLSNAMAPQTTAEIILKFKASGDTDSMNLFKSWYQYTVSSGSGSTSMKDTSKVYNFGTLLQNGKLGGTVYEDTNRNGFKDGNEAGIPGITVRVTDTGGRSYETETEAGGTYSFNSLPGNKKMTVTIVNPESPDPNNASGSYRFSAKVDSTESTIGTDVSPAEDNRTASKSDFTLAGGTAVVNAGLVRPYELTFLVAGGDGITSFVNPSTRKIYAGQKLAEVTERVTVSLAPGLSFDNQWTVLPEGGASTTVSNDKLLEQTVTADTTFTAVTSTLDNIVSAMWWNETEHGITQQFEKEVTWNMPVGLDFPEDSEVNNYPGYRFTGWSVNGTSVIKQRGDIVNEPVKAPVNYIAQYTPRTDITVTLNANGGHWAENETVQTLPNQKFTTSVDYRQPVREGYTFQGWSTDQHAAEGSQSLSVPPDDATFYAVWAPGEVRVTLMPNGGQWTEDSKYAAGYIDGTVGTPATLPAAADLSRTGYDFAGWYVQGDTDQTVVEKYTFPTKAATLIAKWTEKQETVTFNYGEGSGFDPVSVRGAHGSVVGEEQAEYLLEVTRAGYQLTGWKNDATGVVTPAANTGSIVINEGDSYTAVWEQNQSELTFDAGEGAAFPNGGQTKTYYGGAGTKLAAGEPVDPVREGHDFLGWFTQEGTEIKDFTFPNSGGQTYYAHWEKASYRVVFRFNGGTWNDADSYQETVTYLGTVKTVPQPNLQNAQLVNWTDVATGQTYSTEDIQKRQVTGNTIYSANWNVPSYDVTFFNLGNDPDSMTVVSVTAGAGVFAPDPQTPDGKVFRHWLLTSDPNAAKLEYSDEELAKLQVSGPMSFQAVFGEDSYTISFQNPEGKIDGEAEIIRPGGYKLTEDDFPTAISANNNAFKGWFWNGQTKSAADWAGTVVEGNMNFIATFAGDVQVTFDRQGGVWTKSGEEKYAGGLEGPAGTAITLPGAGDLERTGYRFGGWYTDPGCTTGNEAGNTFPTARSTYYAKWIPNQYTVTYELNGGTWNGQTGTITRENLDYDSTLKDVPAPTRGGYTLVGWLVQTEGNPAHGYIIPGANMTLRTVDGDITYVAQWSAMTESVKFHANSGGSTDAQFGDGQEEKTFTGAYNSSMAFADVPTPVREGYTFQGWVTNADGTGSILSGSFAYDGQTKDYYAQWKATQVTVSFNANGGNFSGQSSFTLDYGANHPSNIPTVTLAGSQLAYWLDMETGDKYGAQADPAAGIQAFPTGPVKENKTYLAIWNTVQYQVTFTGYDANSGEKSIPTVYGGTPAAPAVTAPAGQVFQHWKVTASQSANIAVDTIYTADALLDIEIQGDVTFEAVFAPADVTVTYMANGGAFEGGKTSVTISGKSGEAIGNKAPANPTREGYEFTGWDKTLMEFPTENATLMAQWKAKEYQITFDKNLDDDEDPTTDPDNVVTVTGTYGKNMSAENIEGTIPSGFAPEGYTLVGWQDAQGNIVTVIESQIVRGEAVYTAFFSVSNGRQVTFHAAPQSRGSAAFADGKTEKVYSVTTEASLTVADVPLPIWEEHTFLKWVDENGDDAPESLTYDTAKDGAHYYPVYEETTYTVIFNYNGGKDAQNKPSLEITGKTKDQTVSASEIPAVTMEGNTFRGWLNLNDNQTYSAEALSQLPITEDVSYIAQWDTQTHTVTFENAKEGQADTFTPAVVHGQYAPVPATVPQTGHEFTGWFVKAPANGLMIGGELKKTLTADDLTKLTITQNGIVLVAQFAASDCTVIFDANGGQWTGEQKTTFTVPYGGKLSDAEGGFTMSDPVREGSTFEGWTISGDATGRVYKTAEELGEIQITGPTTILAKWQGFVRVTFNANGGTVSPAYLEGKSGTAIAADQIPTPELPGSTFGGWFKDEQLSQPAQQNGSYQFPDASETWYAKWTANDLSAQQNGTLTYNGKGQDAQFTVQQEGEEIPNLKLENITYQKAAGSSNAQLDSSGKPMNAGTYTAAMEVYSGESYLGTVSATVEIKQAKLTAAAVNASGLTFDGSAKEPAVTSITANGETYPNPAKGTDYTVVYGNNINAGTAKATVSGMGNFTGTVEVSFTIAANTGALTVEQTNALTYNGKGQDGQFTVTDGKGNTLPAGSFTVTYTVTDGNGSLNAEGKPCGAGSYTAAITGTGNWAGAAGTVEITVAKYGAKEMGEVLIATNGVSYPTNSSESAFTNHLVVKDIYGNVLALNTDYTISYNTSSQQFPTGVGVYTAAITGTGSNYDGNFAKAELSFVVTDTNLSIVLSKASDTYTGKAFDEDYLKNLVETVGGQSVDWNDYTLSVAGGQTVLNVGSYALIVSAKDGTGSGTALFEVKAKSLEDEDVTVRLEDAGYTYDGAAKEPKVTVQVGGAELAQAGNYTVAYTGNINAGTASVTVTGTGNYTGAAVKTFSIAQKSIGDGTTPSSSLTVSQIPDQTYTGSELTPDVGIKYGTLTLVKDTDYTLAYENNIATGTATVTVTGKGNYTDGFKAAFNIVAPNSLSARVEQNAWTYDGNANAGALTVTFGSETLTQGENGYSLSITKDGEEFTGGAADIQDAGSYVLTVSGTGKYASAGSYTVTITVSQAAVTILPNANQSKTYGEADGTLGYTAEGILPGDDARVEGALGREDGDNAGSYRYTLGTLALTGTKSGNYALALSEDADQFTIVAKLLTEAMVSGVNNSYPYQGSQIKPVPTVTDNGTALTENLDYTLTYGENLNAGSTGKVTVTGRGNYQGTVEKTFAISASQGGEMSLTLTPAQNTYSYGVQKPALMVLLDGRQLTERAQGSSEDGYWVDWGDGDYTAAGTYTVTIHGTGNYASLAEQSMQYTIVPYTGSLSMELSETSFAFGVTAKEVVEQITSVTGVGGEVLSGSTVTIDDAPYADDTVLSEGRHSITVTATSSNYKTDSQAASATRQISVGLRSIEDAAVTVANNIKTYNGKAQSAAVTVELAGQILVENTDFYVVYGGSATDKGEYAITVKGMGNYMGEAAAADKLIIQAKPLADSMILTIPDQAYTGSQVKPAVNVVDQETGAALRQGVDYTVSYGPNTQIGEGAVTITAEETSNYSGTATAKFTIRSRVAALTVEVSPATGVFGESEAPEITVKDGETVLADTDYTLTYWRYTESGALEEAADLTSTAGVYLIQVDGAGSYDGSSQNAVYILKPQAVSGGLTLTVPGADTFVYSGENQSGALEGMTVMAGEQALTGDDYTVTVSRNNGAQTAWDEADTSNVGLYVVTVTAVGGYEGHATWVFTVTPKDISSDDISAEAESATYNTEAQTPSIMVTDETRGEELAEDTDYTVSAAPENGYVDAGTYEITLTGTGNYMGTRVVEYTVEKATITAVCEQQAITYGDPLPAFQSEENPEGLAFQISGILPADEGRVTVTPSNPDPLQPGENHYVFTLSGDKAGNYTVDASGAVLMVSAKDMNGEGSGVTAKLDRSYGYYDEGKPVPPTVVVKDSKLNATLAEGTDYEVSYLDAEGAVVAAPAEKGNYTVVVTGIGHYSGEFRLSYEIREYTSGGSGSGGTTQYTITAEAGKGGSISPSGKVRVDSGDDKTFKIRADEGYAIEDVLVDGKSVGAVSSYTFENVRKGHTISVTFTESGLADPDQSGVSGWLNTTEHNAYLGGYGEGRFGPNDNMTRAQAAQMFYNLLLDKDVAVSVSFQDVSADAWYAKAVNTLGSLGIIAGVGDNRFAPDRAITRAEFATIATRFAQLGEGGENPFPDVSEDAWYYDYVMSAVAYGWIAGYPDGTFGPENTITRAEVTTIVNRMLGRIADKDSINAHAAELQQFSDVPASHWAYYTIMEATNTHEYKKAGGVETWEK